MNKILLLFILLSPFVTFAQKVIKLDRIDLLELSKGEIYFYEKVGNKYKEIYLEITPAKYNNGNKEKDFSIEIDRNNEVKDTNSLLDQEGRLLDIDQIKPSSLKDLKAKLLTTQWKLEGQKNIHDDRTMSTLKLFNEHIFMVQQYLFEKEQSHIADTYFFNYCIIDLGNDRHIVALLDKNGAVTSYIIPTLKRTIVGGVDRYGGEANWDHIKEEKYDNSWKTTMEKLYKKVSPFIEKEYYFSAITKDRKYTLVDIFDEPIFPSAYDTISIGHHFIVTKKENELTLYNSTLEKIPLNNIRAYYFYGPLIQVLQGNAIKKIDLKGKKSNFSNRMAVICGTTSLSNYDATYNFEMMQDASKGNYLNIIIEPLDILGQPTKLFFKKIYFKNLTTDYTLSFFDKRKKAKRNFIPSYEYPGEIPTNWLLISKGNKFGIIKYALNKVKFTQEENSKEKSLDSLKIREEDHSENLYDTTVQVLPIAYDSIGSKQYPYSFPIRIYKNGLVGYFPLNKDVRYSFLGEQQGYFIRFILPNGKKGWLDMKGNEFLDE